MGKKTLSIFIVVLLFSLPLGCGGEATSTTIITSAELVPQKANMIGHIDLSQIIADKDIAELYEAMPIEPGASQTLDEALDLTMEEIGLALMDFGECVIFGGISEATGDMDYGGILVKGTFEESDLIASIESEIDEEFTTINYKGYEIYMDSDEEMGIAFLSSDAFIIGSMEAVEDAIAVKEGDQPAISGKLLDTYNDLADGLVKVAILVPPVAIEEGLQGFGGELPTELPLDALTNIDTVGFTLAKEEQSITFSLKLCFTDSDSAEAVEAFIRSNISSDARDELPDFPEEDGFTTEKGMIELMEQVLELLNKLEVNTTDSCLTISLELTLAEIEDLIETIISMEGSIEPIQPIVPIRPQLPQ
jgi:hypothetical protein